MYSSSISYVESGEEISVWYKAGKLFHSPWHIVINTHNSLTSREIIGTSYFIVMCAVSCRHQASQIVTWCLTNLHICLHMKTYCQKCKRTLHHYVTLYLPYYRHKCIVQRFFFCYCICSAREICWGSETKAWTFHFLLLVYLYASANIHCQDKKWISEGAFNSFLMPIVTYSIHDVSEIAKNWK